MKTTAKRILAVALMVCILVCGSFAMADGFTYADTIQWDGVYDVIVVGFGGAGAVSATYAARNNASVLVTEKAPKGHEGGNSKLCGQLICTTTDYDKAAAYYEVLYGDFDVTDAVMDVYLTGIVNMKETLENELGAEMVISGREHPVAKHAIPEYPELPGSDAIDMYLVSETMSNAALYNLLRSNAEAENVDIWYDAPAKHLIQDPFSKTILGVQIEKQGKMVNIRANNGVVLACGGFENNPQMWQDYLGYAELAVSGSFYNTGDGITMALEVGADLHHMNTWEASGCYGGSTFVPLEGEHTASLTSNSKWNNGSLIAVSGDGTRFLNENFASRHGHIVFGDTWHMTTFPERMYLVFDQAQYDTFLEKNAIDQKYFDDFIISDTVEGLAEALEMENLVWQVEQYNSYAENGEDPQFLRSAESMVAFGEGPYYAIKLLPRILNTQGGPRRNENAEVLDTKGNAIPHLYSAGELGGITANLYQGGGNMAECVIFGKIAGTNAAQPKEPLEEISLEKVESNLVYTPGNDPDAVEETVYELADGEYIGVGEGGMGGTITVKVTMDGDTIAAIEVLEHMETQGICEKALETIPNMVIEQQSVEVDTVSGATLTSKALINAISDALAQTGK